MSLRVKLSIFLACLTFIYFVYIITPVLKAYSFAIIACEYPDEIVATPPQNGDFDWSTVANAKNVTNQRNYELCIRRYMARYGLKHAYKD
jgi:hypothetical protein